MHVLFLDQFSELWGAQKCFLDLLPEIEARGWRTSAALPGDGGLVDRLRARNIPVHAIPCGPYQSGRKSRADMIRFAHDLRDQIRVLHPLEFDLLYVNGPRLLPAAALAVGRRKPVLFHAHSWIARGLEDRLARWCIHRTNAAVVACAEAVAPSVRPDRLKVIPNGMPDLGFRTIEFARWHLGRQRIGIIGRISAEKGQLQLVGAAKILRRELPDARFVICGEPAIPDGPYIRLLRKWANHLGNVDIIGWRDDIQTVFAKLDLLVIASEAEGMPRVLLEAFSAGVPVLAYAVGGIPEAITEGETGLFAEERTGKALAARIREIVQLGQKPLQRIADQARREWKRKYTVEAYRRNITAVMESLVSGRPAAPETESPRSRR